ncbi:MAG: hypothetical protein AAFZ38_10095 [Myxococcota bacterium]
MDRTVLGAVLLISACSGLDTPVTANIACETDAQCPEDFVCGGARRCVSLAAIEQDAPTVQSVSLSQERVGAGGRVQLELTASKRLAASPAVTFQSNGLRSFESVSGEADRYLLEYTSDGEEIPGAAPLSAVLIDETGNRTETPLNISIVFDFEPPVVLAEASRLEVRAPASAFRSDVSSLTDGSELDISIVWNEAIQDVSNDSELGERPRAYLLPIADTELNVERSALNLEPIGFGPRAASTFRAELAEAASLDGEYRVWLSATDIAQNATAIASEFTVSIDSQSPAEPDTDASDSVIYRAAPWGLIDSPLASYSMRAMPGSFEIGSRMLFFDVQTALPGQELGATAVNAGDPISDVPIAADAATSIWAVAVDAAGNPSDADPSQSGVQGTLVRDTEWVATFNGKSRANTASNPHVHRVNRDRDASLEGASPTEPFTELLRSLATVDADGPLAESEPVWREAGGSLFASPSPRCASAFAPSPLDDGLILFGGGAFGEACSTNDGLVCDDTWLWNGRSWTAITVNRRPPGRNGHSLAYDEARGRIVLFGGASNGEGCRTEATFALRDTWVWDGAGWSDRSSVSSPGPRSGHTMVYDVARERVVLFGGRETEDDQLRSREVNDTWVWDGSSWSLEEMSSSAISARSEHAMVYDRARGETLVFGGRSRDPGSDCDSSRLCDGLFGWNGSTWELKNSPGPRPSGRFGASLVYDEAEQRVLLFGGARGGSYLDDVWSWSGDGWTRIGLGVDEVAYQSSAVGFEPSTQEVVAFGGGGPPSRDDCIANEFLTPPFSESACGSLRAFDGTVWTDRTAEFSDVPFVRTEPGIGFVESIGELVLFGGQAAGCLSETPDADDTEACPDSWRFDGVGWRRIVGRQPSSRVAPGVVYDTARQRLVVFGGLSDVPSATCLADGLGCRDTWTYDSDNGWQDITSAPLNESNTPRGRYDSVLVYDVGRDETVLFGGVHEFGQCPGGEVFCDDTWVLSDRTWSRRFPAMRPRARFEGAAAYHAGIGRVFVFGGVDPISFEPTDELWSWDGANWSQVERSGEWPAARAGAFMFYDPNFDALVLHGGNDRGLNADCPDGAALSQPDCEYVDVWLYSQAGWSRFGDLIRTASFGARFAYAQEESRIYGFGQFGRRGVLTSVQLAEVPTHYVTFSTASLEVERDRVRAVEFQVWGDALLLDNNSQSVSSVELACDGWSGAGWQALGASGASPLVLRSEEGAAIDRITPTGLVPIRCSADPEQARRQFSRSVLDAISVTLTYRR